MKRRKFNNKWIRFIANINFALNLNGYEKEKQRILNDNKNLMVETNCGNKEDWIIKTGLNWGSYTENNYAVIKKDNVSFNNAIIIRTKREESLVFGKDWDGKQMTRQCSTGHAKFSTTFSRGMRAVFDCYIEDTGFKNSGHWPAIWLMREVDDFRYFEIDMIEKFGVNPRHAHASIHYRFGLADERKMISNRINIGRRARLIIELIWDFDDIVTIKYNGIKVLKFDTKGLIAPYGSLIISSGLSNENIFSFKEYLLKVNLLKLHSCE